VIPINSSYADCVSADLMAVAVLHFEFDLYPRLEKVAANASSTLRMVHSLLTFRRAFVSVSLDKSVDAMVLGKVQMQDVTVPRRCCAGSGRIFCVAIRLRYSTSGFVIVTPVPGIWNT
jgi:hypothetical protein